MRVICFKSTILPASHRPVWNIISVARVTLNCRKMPKNPIKNFVLKPAILLKEEEGRVAVGGTQ